jgi:hypothetical protein
MISLEVGPATFRRVTWCLNEICYHVFLVTEVVPWNFLEGLMKLTVYLSEHRQKETANLSEARQEETANHGETRQEETANLN